MLMPIHAKPLSLPKILYLERCYALIYWNLVCWHRFFYPVSKGFIRLTSSRDKKMSEQIKHVSDDSFATDVLGSQTPVLVDYWAPWCGPCKMIAPMLEEIANEFGDKVTIAKLNVDENQQTAAKFGIRGIPTLMLFKDGQVKATKVGALSKSQLTEFLNDSI